MCSPRGLILLGIDEGTRPDGWGYEHEILPVGMGMGIKFYPRIEGG